MLDDSKYYSGDGGGWKRGPMIGYGGQGRVYFASALEWATRLPPRIAVKSTTDKLTHLQEQVALTNIGPSPFIIKFAGSDQTRCYDLLFEYASGGTLGSLIRNSGALPESDVIRYTRHILHGLQHIHKRGYVHCDIKPDNILLVGDGVSYVAKIGDLGLAKEVNESQMKWRGTVNYLAPESVTKNVQEPAADIWAVGCTVKEMLQGELHLKDGDERRISGEGLGFVEACMKFRPEDRWTAEMLLKHPFLWVEEKRRARKRRKVSEVIDVDNIIYIDDD